MRFTINREYFVKGLGIASKAIASKTPVPLLMNLKLTLDNRGLVVVGSNGEMTIQSIVPYKVGSEDIIRNASKGETLVGSKIITDIARCVEGKEITLEVVDDTIIKIDDGKSSFQLNSIRAEEYPEINLDVEGTQFDIDCSMLSAIVDQTAFAASTKDQRPILKALNIEIAEGFLSATATDSARMAKKQLPIDINDSIAANISAKTIVDITRLFENEKSAHVSISEKKIMFIFGSTTISATLINGEYPNTKSIVPKNFSYFLEANAQELVSAMERVALISGEKENVIKLTMTEDTVEVSAKSSQTGSASENIGTFQYSGERLEISFNCNYVISAIRAIKSEDVTLAFIGEMKPFVIRNDKDDSVVQLVTPLRTY